jgi:uncharacterized membrane protein YphA (DoxX/SURF4 family)
MNIFLWILQVLIAAQFLQHGLLMIFPPAQYVQLMNANLGIGLRYFIGITELLAVIGIILPGILRIYTWYIPLTGLGLMIITASATVFHAVKGENGSALYTAVLFLIITFTTYMRWKIKPIPPRVKKQSYV